MRVAGGAWAVALLAASAGPVLGMQADPEDLVLRASDGVSVHGAWIRAESAGVRPVLLLFHQGGASGMAEYGPLIPRLTGAGYDLLVVDQRRGGDRFGGQNRTAAGLEGEEPPYCAVYPDLVAALDHARVRSPGAPVVAWGSSYSAALVLKLAADRARDLAGVLAFSPASGDPMAGCDPMIAAANLELPVLVLRPVGEMEIPRVAGQLTWFQERGYQTWVADPGTHGSSMLVAERAEGDVEATWQTVLAFLERALAAHTPP